MNGQAAHCGTARPFADHLPANLPTTVAHSSALTFAANHMQTFHLKWEVELAAVAVANH